MKKSCKELLGPILTRLTAATVPLYGVPGTGEKGEEEKGRAGRIGVERMCIQEGEVDVPRGYE